MKKYLLIISIVLLSLTSYTQEYHSPFQVSFAYPLGTNGVNSMNYTSNFSFNILYGMNGGVNGFELGGIFNYNKGGVRGAQIAGVMNMNQQASNGALISGVLNYQYDDFEGLQLSVVNVNLGNFNGAQIGVVNFAYDFIGAQLGSITVARDFNGLQGGTISVARDLKGAQLGTINIARDVNGLQMGTVNIANKVKGAQIGIINIMGSNNGAIPIGIISVVKNGYYAFELSSNEVIYSNLSYKMGVREFYSIFKIGATINDGEFMNSYGFGFGTLLKISNKVDLAIEATASQIVKNDNWGYDLNLLSRLDLNFHWEVAKGFYLLAGPSYNVYVYEHEHSARYGVLNIPYTLTDEIDGRFRIATWIGVNFGLAFRI